VVDDVPAGIVRIDPDDKVMAALIEHMGDELAEWI
jgi:hypothetical protein